MPERYLASPWSCAVLMISLPIALAFLYRIHVEECALVQALGDRYRSYIKRTKRLIPLVY